MQRKDVADIRIARVVAAQALGICDHLHDDPGGLFSGGSHLDVVVEALAHLVHTIRADDLGNWVTFICGSTNVVVL